MQSRIQYESAASRITSESGDDGRRPARAAVYSNAMLNRSSRMNILESGCGREIRYGVEDYGDFEIFLGVCQRRGDLGG